MNTTKDFPLLRPMDLTDEEEQKAAKDVMFLVERIESGLVEKFIAAEWKSFCERSVQDQSVALER